MAGQRREEVATLAGVSVDYYTRLERGNARGASDGVLEALARALQLEALSCRFTYGRLRTPTGRYGTWNGMGMARRCPRCGSRDVSWAGGSPPFGIDHWECGRCRNRWMTEPGRRPS